MNKKPGTHKDPHVAWKKACPYCQAPIRAQELIRPGHCGAESCARQHILAGARKVEERKKQEDAARLRAAVKGARKCLKSVAASHGCNPEDLIVTVVPYQNEPLTLLPEGRNQAFVAHLGNIVKQAFAIEPDEISQPNFSPNDEPEHPVISAACAICQGRCCRLGAKKNAFLLPQNIRHHRLRNADLTPDQILEVYIAALPDISVRDACVFQGSEGCTLPRDLRSDVCNSFLCRDVHVIFQAMGDTTDPPLAIVAINEEQPQVVAGFGMDQGLWQVKLND